MEKSQRNFANSSPGSESGPDDEQDLDLTKIQKNGNVLTTVPSTLKHGTRAIGAVPFFNGFEDSPLNIRSPGRSRNPAKDTPNFSRDHQIYRFSNEDYKSSNK